MRVWLTLLGAASPLVITSAAMAQAQINRVINGASGATVQRAGVVRSERATAGMKLLPGDLLMAVDTSRLELTCAAQTTTYRLTGPFRALVDVPDAAKCALDVLTGHGEVLSEDPTSTTAGGVPLGSRGTQYSVTVTRDSAGPVLRVVVFEGTVLARAGEVTLAQGAAARWARGEMTRGAPSRGEIERSATEYATFDLAAARETTPAAVTSATYEQLRTLHYQVLSNPADTATRVRLAKRQIEYKADDQAAYNLKRANVTTDAALRRYDIDPVKIRENPKLRDRIYRDASVAPVRPDAASSAAAAAATSVTTPAATPSSAATTAVSGLAGRERTVSGRTAAVAGASIAGRITATTDSDLQLIVNGQTDTAIQNLESRVAAGTATSRDHYALTKAYGGRSAERVRQHASRALILHATDGRLSATELREIGELLGRAG